MTDRLSTFIKSIAQERVSRCPQLYEDSFSGVDDVTKFFTTTAELFLGKGWTEQEIIDLIKESIGDYLLGKKYGVTPALYVSNCIEERERQAGSLK